MASQLLSGGAHGSDLVWTARALEAGYRAKIISFSGHARASYMGAEVSEIPQTELDRVRPLLVQISPGKHLPRLNAYNYNLLARNVFIVQSAEAVYAVCKTREWKDGGTGWTLSLAMTALHRPHIFIFCLDVGQWFCYNRETRVWVWSFSLPSSFGIWAGIGTRELPKNDPGIIQVIDAVLHQE